MFTYKIINDMFIPYFIPDQYRNEINLSIPVNFIDIVTGIDWNISILAIQNELVQNNIFTKDELNTANGQRILMKSIQKNIYNKIKDLYNNPND